jgi:hypothetical protein
MSLRPRDPRVARVRRAGQRMAPGGRRWSESPIPRVGVRRTRRGVTPGWTLVEDGYVLFAGYTYISPGWLPEIETADWRVTITWGADATGLDAPGASAAMHEWGDTVAVGTYIVIGTDLDGEVLMWGPLAEVGTSVTTDDSIVVGTIPPVGPLDNPPSFWQVINYDGVTWVGGALHIGGSASPGTFIEYWA